MIRIRFHGRGGHGIKTASRMIGTAAFAAGYHTQDSPIYGAERRGAAIAAFTRISPEPILERGIITSPDLIVVGDDSLLADPGAGVLLGHHTASAIFINTPDASNLRDDYQIVGEIRDLDITKHTLEVVGKASALSVGLAAATARLIGILSKEQLLAAAREELEHTGITEQQLANNLELASRVFDALSPLADLKQQPFQSVGAVSHVPHQRPLLSTPSILSPGNSEERNTGTWRVERPEIDCDVCTRCGICFIRCPDGAISLNAEGFPIIDYENCKGCMECWDQCPVDGAIQRVKEVRSW